MMVKEDEEEDVIPNKYNGQSDNIIKQLTVGSSLEAFLNYRTTTNNRTTAIESKHSWTMSSWPKNDHNNSLAALRMPQWMKGET